MSEENLPKTEESIKEDIAKIRKLASEGKLSFPKAVEDAGIFPIKMRSGKEITKDDFSYSNIGAIWEKTQRTDDPTYRGGFIINWGAKGIGFGELTFRVYGEVDESGELINPVVKCETETMGAKFVKAALLKLAESVIIVE